MSRGLAFGWAVLLGLSLLLEGYTLGTRDTAETLSGVVRAQLHHPIGRFVFYPLWAWLTWHWFLAGRRETPTWRDLVAVAIGLAAAWLVTVRSAR